MLDEPALLTLTELVEAFPANVHGDELNVLNRIHEKHRLAQPLSALDIDVVAGYALNHTRAIFDDRDLHPDYAIETSLVILESWLKTVGLSLNETDKRWATDHAGILGLAGEIARKRWTRTAKWSDLRQAWAYNARGYAQGINSRHAREVIFDGFFAALLLDQIAHQEELALGSQQPFEQSYGVDTADVQSGQTKTQQPPRLISTPMHDEASAIRNQLTPLALSYAAANPDDWELRALLGALYFALADWDTAKHWAGQVPSEPNEEDKLQMWIHEYILLAQLKGVHDPRNQSKDVAEAHAVLNQLLPSSAGAGTVVSATRGKLGMALSGGGFRAAFYHIGVLARLAEANLLPRVEVLSCVSGGSIVGVHYSLLLQELFETHQDKDISTELTGGDSDTIDSYFAVIDRLIADFARAASFDYRNRIFSNPFLTLRMLGPYSRSLRMGALLEEHLLPEVQVLKGDHVEKTRLTLLNELRVQPRIAEDEWHRSFKPRYHNWRRRNRVPIMILNATTVNTGHNWQFTARHMGEPRAAIHPEIDPNPRLPRVEWDWPKDEFRNSSANGGERRSEQADQPSTDDEQRNAAPLKLGDAIAASAAVPVLFPALSIEGVYEDRLVKLADGGVVDNQGITGLLEQGCVGIIVSDASGRLRDVPRPHGGISGLLRTSEISMAQIRARQYDELSTRTAAGLLRGFTYLNLTHGLRPDAVPIAGHQRSDERRFKQEADLTPLGRSITEDLADVRTDLDAFSETEAFTLMYAGYEGMDKALAISSVEDRDEARAPGDWAFRGAKELFVASDSPQRRHLKKSSRRVLRSWVHKVWLGFVTMLAGLAVWQVVTRFGLSPNEVIIRLTYGFAIAWALLTVGALAFGVKTWITKPRSWLHRWIIPAVARAFLVLFALTIGFTASWTLLIGNRLAQWFDRSWRIPAV